MAGIKYVTDSGCKDCKDRTITCHSTCKKYLEWKKSDKKQRKIIDSKIRKQSDYFYHK